MAIVTHFSPTVIAGTTQRPSPAYQVTAAGALQSVPADVLRSAHHTGGRRVFLIEREYTNPLADPHDYSGYTLGRSSVVPDSVVAPDGVSMAQMIREDATSGTHAVTVPTAQAITPVAGQPITVSWFVRAAGRSHLQFDLPEGAWEGGGTASMIANLETGAMAGGNATMRHLEALGSGWFRASVRAVATAATPFRPRVILRTASSGSYEGDGASGVQLWGLQVEIGAWGPSSFAAGLREEDRFYIDHPLTPQQGGSIYVKLIERGGVLTPNAGVIYVGSPDGGPRLFIASGGGYYRASLNPGSQNNYSSLAGLSVPTWGQEVELLVVHDPDTRRARIYQSINGGAVEQGTLSSAVDIAGGWGAPRLYVGSQGNVNQSVLHGLEVKVADSPATMAEMRTMEMPSVILRPISTPSSEWPTSHYSRIDEEVIDISDYNESGPTGEQTDIQRYAAVPARIVTTGGVDYVATSAGKVSESGEYVSASTGDPLSLEIELLVAGGTSYSPPIVWTHLLGLHTSYLDPIPAGTVVTGNPRVRYTTRRT